MVLGAAAAAAAATAVLILSLLQLACRHRSSRKRILRSMAAAMNSPYCAFLRRIQVAD